MKQLQNKGWQKQTSKIANTYKVFTRNSLPQTERKNGDTKGEEKKTKNKTKLIEQVVRETCGKVVKSL